MEAARRASSAAAGPLQQQRRRQPVPEVAELLLLEGLIWRTLDSIAVLAARARKVVPEVLLPPALLALRPSGMAAPAAAGEAAVEPSSPSGAAAAAEPGAPSSAAVHAGPEDAAEGACGDAEGSGQAATGSGQAAEGSGQAATGSGQAAEYPPVRRAQRLSYALATALQKDFTHADGRQVGSLDSCQVRHGCGST